MRILFIRHAEAVEAEAWLGDDMSRPLSKKGAAQAKSVAKFLKKFGPPLQAVISSETVRSRETAMPVARSAGKRIRISSSLNPGCTVCTLCKLLSGLESDGVVAVVGHEPDLSKIISQLCGSPKFRIKMTKASTALIEYRDDRSAELRWLVPPLPMNGKKRPDKLQ